MREYGSEVKPYNPLDFSIDQEPTKKPQTTVSNLEKNPKNIKQPIKNPTDSNLNMDPNLGDLNEQIQKVEKFENSKIKKIDVDLANFVLTDKMIEDLEDQLLLDDNETELSNNKSAKENMENNMRILNIIRRRILLKQKAFELFPAIIKSNYSSLCRFFLLKSQLFLSLIHI